MRLGNSNGNNKGKKYMMRGKNNLQATAESCAKAELFSDWFARAYRSLERELKQKTIFDEDVLNDTFLRIYENILLGSLDIDHYRSYFMRSFFTNYIQGSIRQKRYCEMSPFYDAADVADNSLEMEMAQRRLEEDIFTYVYERYDVREFEIFKMYVSLKPAVNYHTLAQMTKMKTHCIQFIVSKIKKDVCANRDFATRRREVSC